MDDEELSVHREKEKSCSENVPIVFPTMRKINIWASFISKLKQTEVQFYPKELRSTGQSFSA